MRRSAESVSPKHPDKICDQISDAILDAYLVQDPRARVAVECCGGHGELFIVGEVTSTTKRVNVREIAERVTGKKISLKMSKKDGLKLSVKITRQSAEIARGVDTGGAGDQGIMIGYATNETPEFLPREVVLARRLNQMIYAKYPYDGKTQVTLNRGRVESIVASFQNTTVEDLEMIIAKFLKKYQIMEVPRLFLNPAGNWTQGGFDADTGLTGRKLIVDNYGPRVPIGGGCFSGKDASKVDRSAAYMARRIAVDYLKAYGAKEVYVRLAYAIGCAEPLEATVVLDRVEKQIKRAEGTRMSDNSCGTIAGYDLTPNAIRKYLRLNRPIYEKTARYGHFGEGFCWG